MAEKKKKDDVEVAALIKRGTPAAPVKMATDGGIHQVFAEALQGGRAVRGKDGEIERINPTSAPGTIPPNVNRRANVVVANAPAAPRLQPQRPPVPRRLPMSSPRAPRRSSMPRPAQAAAIQTDGRGNRRRRGAASRRRKISSTTCSRRRKHRPRRLPLRRPPGRQAGRSAGSATRRRAAGGGAGTGPVQA